MIPELAGVATRDRPPVPHSTGTWLYEDDIW